MDLQCISNQYIVQIGNLLASFYTLIIRNGRRPIDPPLIWNLGNPWKWTYFPSSFWTSIESHVWVRSCSSLKNLKTYKNKMLASVWRGLQLGSCGNPFNFWPRVLGFRICLKGYRVLRTLHRMAFVKHDCFWQHPALEKLHKKDPAPVKSGNRLQTPCSKHLWKWINFWSRKMDKN